MTYFITGIDLVLIILYFGLILGIGSSFSKKIANRAVRSYFMKGLALKLVCGLGFGWVYVYYYGGGDTTMYFRGASVIYDQVIGQGNGLDVFFNDYLLASLISGSDSKLFTYRFAGFLNFFSFNSYWACTLLFSFLSFLGMWLIFQSFYRIYPRLYKPLAIAALFVPGVAFWSAGIMKDSICMLFVGVVVYFIQNIFIFGRQKILSACLVAIGFYVLITLKAYIAMALLVALALYALLALKSRIKNKAARIVAIPLLAVSIFAIAAFTLNEIGQSLERYSLENIVETAQTYQGYHTRTSTADRRGNAVRTGSSYNLGEINFNSPVSIVSKIPAAINVTFFRPYVWEVTNPVMLLSALESLIILIFTLKVIRRTGIGRFFKLLVSYKEVLFCISFALIFGFAVGFTTYNFGSLVRYKAPCIPFFLIALVLINDLPVKKKASTQKRIRRMPVQPAIQRLPS
ncbi:hypothetical protein [Terrimonas alba]|uniref:hypothetical protein n=1 Tax=Terrimonas alba TaxID=3349636 RepID=UPI0035F444D4